MDLVYVTTDESTLGFPEILLSLRSVDKYARNVEQIIIVGHLNPRLNPRRVVHIPFEVPPVHPNNRARNVYEKLKVIRESGIMRKEFILMNDDFFFCKETSLDNFPVYTTGEAIPEEDPSKTLNGFTLTRNNTLRLLRHENADELNYDLHVPCRLTKKQVAFMDLFEWDALWGFLINSSVHNLRKTQEPVVTVPRKVFDPTPARITEFRKHVDTFSLPDRVPESVVDYMLNEFHARSRWELY